MNKSKEIAIVEELTKIKDKNRIVLNEVGWTSRVYIVDDGEIVFKFPSRESLEMEWLQKTFHKRKRILKEHFNKNELDTIEELVSSLPEKSANLGIEQVFCHCDLGYNNILLTDNLEVGIIDFGDAGIYDKSYDFIGLEDEMMLDAAITAYGGDEILRKKVAIRRPLLPLMEMLYLIDRKDTEGIRKCAGKMSNNLKQLKARK